MKNFGITLWNLFENIFSFKVYKVLHLKLRDNTWDKLMQFVKFGIVGVSNTVRGKLSNMSTIQ